MMITEAAAVDRPPIIRKMIIASAVKQMLCRKEAVLKKKMSLLI
jgi:hypothetical protein